MWVFVQIMLSVFWSWRSSGIFLPKISQFSDHSSRREAGEYFVNKRLCRKTVWLRFRTNSESERKLYRLRGYSLVQSTWTFSRRHKLWSRCWCLGHRMCHSWTNERRSLVARQIRHGSGLSDSQDIRRPDPTSLSDLQEQRVLRWGHDARTRNIRKFEVKNPAQHRWGWFRFREEVSRQRSCKTSDLRAAAETSIFQRCKTSWPGVSGRWTAPSEIHKRKWYIRCITTTTNWWNNSWHQIYSVASETIIQISDSCERILSFRKTICDLPSGPEENRATIRSLAWYLRANNGR